MVRKLIGSKLPSRQELEQGITDLEILNAEQEQYITDLEINQVIAEQQMTDMEMDIFELQQAIIN